MLVSSIPLNGMKWQSEGTPIKSSNWFFKPLTAVSIALLCYCELNDYSKMFRCRQDLCVTYPEEDGATLCAVLHCVGCTEGLPCGGAHAGPSLVSRRIVTFSLLGLNQFASSCALRCARLARVEHRTSPMPSNTRREEARRELIFALAYEVFQSLAEVSQVRARQLVCQSFLVRAI